MHLVAKEFKLLPAIELQAYTARFWEPAHL
jgi:hypothetical protein